MTSSPIRQVTRVLSGLPACVAGSSVAIEEAGLPAVGADVDVFCYTDSAFFTGINMLLHAGAELDERNTKLYSRWLRYGLGRWHTNSIKFHLPDGSEVNLVYKIVGSHPVSSLSAVLETFDFGLLGLGYDLYLYDQQPRDMRTFLFPQEQDFSCLPMMPNKAAGWEQGLISQYNGLRMPGRYAKYHKYGFNMGKIKPVLLTGYASAIDYNHDRGGQERTLLAEIYTKISEHIQNDEVDELLEAAKIIPVVDSLDQVMEALE